MRLIDGDALKRKAQKIAVESWKMQMTAKVETVLNQFIDWIEEAPTVNAVPVVHGRWKPDTAFGNDIMSGRMVLCSRCGKGVMTGPVPYCPWCGARMDGGD